MSYFADRFISFVAHFKLMLIVYTYNYTYIKCELKKISVVGRRRKKVFLVGRLQPIGERLCRQGRHLAAIRSASA
jgi:hypothetical protein